MHIVHIAAELAPIAKVGGLADVVLGLSRELSWKKHDVDIFIPKYDCLDTSLVRDLNVDYHNLYSFYQGQWYPNTVWMGWVENLKVYFLEPHHPRFFFNRGCYYGCEDDVERFLYFSRAAIEFLYKRGIHPDVLHLHDWQTSAVAPLYREMYQQLGYTKPKVVATIHNLEYQGKCQPHELDFIGLSSTYFQQADKLQDGTDPTLCNLLKGAIVYADVVTTVSPTYAEEVLTPEGGRGLDAILREHRQKFFGILNGVDYSYWNPEIDRYLPVHFSQREYPANKKDHSTLDKKGLLKKQLRERLCLAEEHRPIVACITRLVPQKGIELIRYAIEQIDQKKAQCILLGSGSVPEINREFYELKHRFADHLQVHIILQHQEELAHLIFAGADMLIVPSLFEPCGLTQMIALKYGTVPIVRQTGGLADTIFDVDHSNKSFEETNGYVFKDPTPAGLDSALDRAIRCWFDEPERWRRLMLNGMRTDYSWNHSSDRYIGLYNAPCK